MRQAFIKQRGCCILVSMKNTALAACLFILAIPLLLSTTACRKKDAQAPVITDSIGKINRWIYDSMRYYYYWNQSIPAHPDFSLPGFEFFKSLLNKEDRFSAISDRVNSTANKSSFDLYGFHYALVQHPAYSNGLLGVILYTAQGSVAYNLGLRRGSCFIKVNGETITTANAAGIQATLCGGGTITLDTVRWQNNQFLPGASVQVGAAYIAENPVVQTRYFDYNGIKTGYLFYNAFNESYDAVLLQAFTKLKQAGVQECIVDLRYNPGGVVSTAAKLAGMLANVQAGSRYVIFQGNNNGGRQTYTLEQMLQTSGSAAGKTMAELTSRRLNLQRVFLLTTRSTVSAAELLVQTLKPYTQAIQLGDTTTGKDEASFRIEDMRNPRQVQWVIQPTIYKLFNGNNEGNYSKGLAPAYRVDELSAFPLQPIGSPADPLVHQALQMIYGNAVVNETDLRQMPSIKIKPVLNSAAQHALLAPPVLLPSH